MRLLDVVAIRPPIPPAPGSFNQRLPDDGTGWLSYNTTDEEMTRHFDSLPRSGGSNTSPMLVRFTPPWGAVGHVWEGQVVGHVFHRSGASIISVKVNTEYAIHQIADHDVVLTTYNSIASNRFYAAIDWHRIVLDECQGHILPTHPINTPYRHTLSTPIPTIPVNEPSHYTHQHILPTYPPNTSYHKQTHVLNTPYLKQNHLSTRRDQATILQHRIDVCELGGQPPVDGQWNPLGVED